MPHATYPGPGDPPLRDEAESPPHPTQDAPKIAHGADMDVLPGPPGGVAIRTSEQVDQIIPALVAAQLEMGPIPKSKVATVKSQRTGKTYSYSYAPLPVVLMVVLPPLNAHGIALVQGAHTDGTMVTVATRLYHASGQWIETSMTGQVGDDSWQVIAGGVTYGRRYTVELATGVAATEDDDAQASQRTYEESREPAPPQEDAHPKALRKFHARMTEALDRVLEDERFGGVPVTENEKHELRAAVIRAYTDEEKESAKDVSAHVLDVISEDMKKKEERLVDWFASLLAAMRLVPEEDTPEPPDGSVSYGDPGAPDEPPEEVPADEPAAPTTCAADGCNVVLDARARSQSDMFGLPEPYCEEHQAGAVKARAKGKEPPAEPEDAMDAGPS